MRVQLITRDNGLGLSHDVRVLRSALVGISGDRMEVLTTDWQASVRPDRFDLNIFLELVNPAHFKTAKRNVLVPNPEWFASEWRRFLPSFNEVWAKTRDCQRIFDTLTPGRVHFTGWTSNDLKDPTVAKERKLLHVAGGSSAKGTTAVLEAMRRLPQHQLTIVSRTPIVSAPPNVKVLGRQSDRELRDLMNSHAIHLCPSSYEGFGHYINEARSVGAFIVTTNAEPMNELVTPDFGIGAAVAHTSIQNLAMHKHVDVASLARCIDLAMGVPLEVLTGLGARARDAYELEALDFEHRLIEILQ